MHPYRKERTSAEGAADSWPCRHLGPLPHTPGCIPVCLSSLRSPLALSEGLVPEDRAGAVKVLLCIPGDGGPEAYGHVAQ